MIFAEKLNQFQMKLIGVASTNSEAVGYLYAQQKGIFTTADFRDFYKLDNLDMIIELTGRDDLANEIYQTKPESVRVMDHVAARVFWDVFQVEEESLAERLFKEGFKSISTIASADTGSLTAIPGVDEKAAQTWIDEAGRILAGEPGGGNA